MIARCERWRLNISQFRSSPDAVIYATEIPNARFVVRAITGLRINIGGVRFRSGSLLDLIPKRVRGHVTVVLGNVPYVPKAANGRADWPVGTAYGEWGARRLAP